MIVQMLSLQDSLLPHDYCRDKPLRKLLNHLEGLAHLLPIIKILLAEEDYAQLVKQL